MIDAGEHLSLLKYIIGQLNIPAWLADEAYSEGLVSLTIAAQKYDDKKGVPEAAWLASYIKWELLSWQKREYTKFQVAEYPAEARSTFISIELDAEHKAMLSEAVIASEYLEPWQRLLIFGDAYGMFTNNADNHRMLKRYGIKVEGQDIPKLITAATDKLSNIIMAQRLMKGAPVTEEMEMAIAGKNGATATAAPPSPKVVGKRAQASAPAPVEEEVESQVVEEAPKAAPKAKATTPKAAATPKPEAAPKVAPMSCSFKQKDGVTDCKMPALKDSDPAAPHCFNHATMEYKQAHRPNLKTEAAPVEAPAAPAVEAPKAVKRAPIQPKARAKA